MEIRAAGCVFLNNNNEILSGYSPKFSCFSGFGGKREDDEMPRQTAFRETIEELLDIKPPVALVNELARLFSSRPFLQRDEYGFMVLSYDDYTAIAKTVKKYFNTSSFYDTFPMTMFHLIIDRKPDYTKEVTTLRTLTMGVPPLEDVDTEFVHDWRQAIDYLRDIELDAYSTDSSE
jgi:NUDIX domain